MYSTEDFYRDWRFSIEKDFLDCNGKPFTYADNGLKEWGDEDLSIPSSPWSDTHGMSAAAISDDTKTIAVACNQEINVFNVDSSKQTFTLQGHLSKVVSIAFVPGRSNLLVSNNFEEWHKDGLVEPQIIFWDLDDQSPNKFAQPETLERLSRNAANTIVADMKQLMRDVHVEAAEQKDLAETLRHQIGQFVLPKGVTQNTKLHGRLLNSFGAYTFNPSGSMMIYLPGSHPKSNDFDDWEVRVYAIDRRADDLKLKGHFDTVTWAGYSLDESLIGTVSWDQTMRIWDANDGTQKHVFTTRQQNWTGGFSPNGQYFAGTSGDGSLHVYNLENGTEHMSFKVSDDWCRTLSWHPSSHRIAVGCNEWGTFMLLDVDKQEIVQQRILNSAAMKLPDDPRLRDIAKSSLEVYKVEFVDDGRKLAIFTSGDGSAEVYDIERARKWRFARAGTMSPRDVDVTSKGGFSMLVNENRKDKKINLVTVDGDDVRLWHVPMSS